MAYSYSDLTTDIRNYTEVDSNVFTAAIINGFLRNAENRINLDCPMDSDRIQAEAQFATDFNSITMPTGLLFVRGIEVYDSTTATTGEGVWLERRDQTFISEYVGELTGTEGGSTGQDTTGLPKYYSMFGGATTGTSSNAGAAGYKWGANADVVGARALFCGAQALALADIGLPEMVEDTFDYGNQSGISVGKIFGLRKPKYNSDVSGSVQDFGVIALDTAQ